MKKLFIIGSGGFSKQVIELIEKINEENKTYELVGLIDDNEKRIGLKVLGYKIVATIEYLKYISEKSNIYCVIAIADGNVRKKIAQQLKCVRWVNLIHPNTVISNYIQLGKGNIICGGVVINPDCVIGNHCHINIGSTFGHDIEMNDFVTIMPGSRISGNVLLKENSTVGTGSIIIQGLNLEENVALGAGTVLTKNTEKDSLYVGVPAYKVK